MTEPRTGRLIIIFAAVMILFAGMKLTAPLMGPLLLILFFAILCRPIYVWLLDRGVNGGLAIGLVGTVMVGIALTLVWIIVGSLSGLLESLNEYSDMLGARVDDMNTTLNRVGIPLDLSAVAAGGRTISLILLALIGRIARFSINFVYIVVGVLFLIQAGPSMWNTGRQQFGDEHPLIIRLKGFGPVAVQYFGMRTYLNALTGLAIGIALIVLGIDFAPLWAVLVFLLSYVPYIGLFVAGAPPVVIALAEYGMGRAMIVVAMIIVVNMLVEYIAMPRMIGKGFRVSPFVIYVAFFFWTWLLGPAGALLASFLSVLFILVLDSFDETRWIATLLSGGVSSVEQTNEQPLESSQAVSS